MIRPREVALFLGGSALNLMVTLGSGVLVARWLGPHDYGVLSLVRGVYAVAAILAPLGLDVSLLRHLGEVAAQGADPTTQVRRFRQICAGVNLAVAAVGALVVGPWVGAAVYHEPRFAWLLAGALAALPFAGDVAILTATLRAAGRVSAQNLAALVLQPIARAVALVLLLWAGAGVMGVVVATAIGAAVAAATMHLALRRGRPLARRATAEDRAAVRRVFGYSAWLAGLMLLYNGLRVIDVLVLGHARPAAEVGAYAALGSLAYLITLPGQALSQTLAPAVARLHAAGDQEGARRALAGYLRAATLVSAPAFAVVAAFGTWLDLLFGPGFHVPWALPPILATAYLVAGCLGPMSASLTMTGRHRQELAILAAGALGAFVLCWALAPAFGGVGVAAGLLCGYLLVNGARTLRSAAVLGGLDVSLGDGAAPVACLAVAAACRWAADRLLPHGWGGAVVIGVVLLGAFAALYAAVLLRPLEKQVVAGWLRTRLAAQPVGEAAGASSRR